MSQHPLVLRRARRLCPGALPLLSALALPAIAQPSAPTEPEQYGVQLSPRAPVQAFTDGGAAGYIAGYLNGTTLTKTVMFQKSGKIGIGTLNPPHTLSVAGNIATNKALVFLGTNGTGIVFGDGSTQTKAATPIVAPFALTGNTVNAAFAVTNSGGDGIRGTSTLSGANGVVGIANTGLVAYGVFGSSAEGNGVRAQTITGTALSAQSLGSGLAGKFVGNVSIEGDLQISGTVSKGGGSFKIDHPLDPANRYLSHSFVESPDMKNVYDGVVTTDARGLAVVQMPAYFDALNRDFRYQLTCIGQFAQAIVAQEMKANRFSIKTDKPRVKVSWQVTGIRRDAYARDHRIRVEEPKANSDRGKYLYPAGFGAPASKQIGAQRPQLAATDR